MEEIEEIRKQFDKAERETDPVLKLQLIKTGIELIKDFKEENTEDNNAYIEKFLIAYARRFLEQIVKIKEIDSYLLWLEYIILFIAEFNQQVQIVLESNAVLKKDFEDFISLWGDKKALIAALNRQKTPPKN